MLCQTSNTWVKHAKQALAMLQNALASISRTGTTTNVDFNFAAIGKEKGKISHTV